MNKKIDLGQAGLYNYSPKGPVPGNDLAKSDFKPSQPSVKSAQGTIEDKLNKIITTSNTDYPELVIQQVLGLITTETTKAAQAALKPIQAEAQYQSEKAERKELHSNVEGVLEMVEDMLAALQKEHQKGDV